MKRILKIEKYRNALLIAKETSWANALLQVKTSRGLIRLDDNCTDNDILLAYHAANINSNCYNVALLRGIVQQAQKKLEKYDEDAIAAGKVAASRDMFADMSALKNATDKELYNELKSRGYAGELKKITTYSLT